MVKFGDGPWAQVLQIVNFGGTVAINNGVASILHKVDTVMINSL